MPRLPGSTERGRRWWGETEGERRTIDNIPYRLQPRASYRPLVHVEFIGFLVQPYEQHVTPDVEHGVNTGGEEGQR